MVGVAPDTATGWTAQSWGQQSAGEIMGARNSVHFIYIYRYARNIVVVDYPMQQTVELSIICTECHLSAYLQGALFRLIRGGATAAAA